MKHRFLLSKSFQMKSQRIIRIRKEHEQESKTAKSKQATP